MAGDAEVRTQGEVRRARAAVVAAFVIHGLLFASWVAHIPHVKASLGIGDATLGLALLGAPVGSVAATAAVGYLIPRLGSRRVMRVALAGYCLAGLLIGAVNSVLGLFLALAAWGAFQGALDIGMNTQAIAVERRAARPLMNTMHACWSIGAFLGAGAGTVAVALGIGLLPQFAVLAGVALVAGQWLARHTLADDAPGGSPETSHPRAAFRLSWPMLLLAAIAFASMLCEGAAADWSPVYLRDSLGSGAAVAGLGYTGFALAMVTVRLCGDRLLARFGAHTVLPAFALLATVVFSAALAIAAPPAALVGFLVLGFGVGAVIPTAFSAAGRLPDVHPGVGVATVSGLGWVGFVLGPPLIGQLAGAVGLGAALIVVPVLTGCIALATRRVATVLACPA